MFAQKVLAIIAYSVRSVKRHNTARKRFYVIEAKIIVYSVKILFLRDFFGIRALFGQRRNKILGLVKISGADIQAKTCLNQAFSGDDHRFRSGFQKNIAFRIDTRQKRKNAAFADDGFQAFFILKSPASDIHGFFIFRRDPERNIFFIRLISRDRAAAQANFIFK